MKTFAELNVGDEFYSECKITNPELDAYLKFSGIKNIIYDDTQDKEERMVSGRAILSKMEGEFTRQEQMYGNLLIFYGIDGDPEWKNRQTRFLKPLHTGETLKIKFKISDKREISQEFGLIAVDFEGTNQEGKTVVVSKKNLYQMKLDFKK
ncbi:MAG TPA: hypothetical protein VFA69_07490 [Candidatus Nitrosotalea sp.]|nr:hypothetical protein [Candidatus Nitrosotalea sp.]